MKNPWIKKHEKKTEPQWYSITVTCDMGQMDIYLDGELVETKVYTMSLSEDEINSLYNNWNVVGEGSQIIAT